MKLKHTSALIIFILLGIFGLTTSIYSLTIHASGLSRSEIQDAVNNAVLGDVVELPAGENNAFPGTVYVTAGIEIRGQGKDTTILSRNVLDGRNPMFSFDGSNGESIIFSNLTLDGVGDSVTLERGVFITGECRDIKIWNCRFEDLGYYGIFLDRYTTGVIWDCDFVDCFASGFGYGVVVAYINWAPVSSKLLVIYLRL